MEKSNIKIIAGKFRGKKLYMASKSTTRSSKNRLKESLFNTLQFEIYSSVWVEVFSGTGSVGLEAMSRGAEKIYFLEKNSEAFKVLKKNIESMEPEKCHAYLGDSFEIIDDVIESLQRDKKKAYFYFDPPFSIREGYDTVYEKVVRTIARLPKTAVKKIIIEHESSIKFSEMIGKYHLIKSKKYGKSTLSYFE